MVRFFGCIIVIIMRMNCCFQNVCKTAVIPEVQRTNEQEENPAFATKILEALKTALTFPYKDAWGKLLPVFSCIFEVDGRTNCLI